MIVLRTLFLFVALALAGTFFPGEANAHAGHHHEHALGRGDIETSALTQKEEIQEQSTDAHSSHTPQDGGVICIHGCCSGVCAACCVVASSDTDVNGPVYFQSDSEIWRHYKTPIDALNLPDTPPPRV